MSRDPVFDRRRADTLSTEPIRESAVGRLTPCTLALPGDTNAAGDFLGIYTRVERVGRIPVLVHVEARARRDPIGLRGKLTHGRFEYVAVDRNGRPICVPPG